jgi:hypothetical protein
MCSIPCIEASFMKKPANALVITYVVIDHTYMFRSPSATILRACSIKEYNKKLCVANLFQGLNL